MMGGAARGGQARQMQHGTLRITKTAGRGINFVCRAQSAHRERQLQYATAYKLQRVVLSRPVPAISLDVHIRSYLPTDWPQVCRVHDAARVQELAAGAVDPRAFCPMVDAAEGDEFFASDTLVDCRGEMIAGFVSWNKHYN